MDDILKSPEVRLGAGVALGRALSFVFPYVSKKLGVTTLPGYLTNLVGAGVTLYLNKKYIPKEYRDIVTVGAVTVAVDSLFDWAKEMGWLKFEEQVQTASFQEPVTVYYPEEEEKKAQIV